MSAYLRDPEEIYRRSFDTIRAETDLGGLPEDLVGVALRLVHACGMTDILGDLRFTEDAVAVGRAALRQGAPILADSRMTAAGIMIESLPATNPVICEAGNPELIPLAERLGTTRSAAAIELLRPRLDGAIVTVGTAPTALFHLLDLIREGGPKPALVLGFPVGFVGAAESKEALANFVSHLPHITLLGRRGGSAMAAAAVNALALGA